MLSLAFPWFHHSNSDQELHELHDMPLLPALPSLTSLLLTLTATSDAHTHGCRLPIENLHRLRDQVDFPSLDRLALLGMFMEYDTLLWLLKRINSVSELYIGVEDAFDLVDAIRSLKEVGHEAPTFPNLKILHVNIPPHRGAGPTRDSSTKSILRALAVELEGLEQIGSLNRVYEIQRWLDPSDKWQVQLKRWSKVNIPGYFQIWRA